MKTSDIILVVDLNGTLIRTDIFQEAFWSSFSKDWKTPFKVINLLSNDKVKIKENLDNLSEIDIRLLPYNKLVIEYIKQFNNNGGHTVLITNNNINIAKKIANYLGFFDEVHQYSSSRNLVGEKKRELLISLFGKKKFNYIGSSQSDIPVWKNAFKAINVNTSNRLRKQCNNVNINNEHLENNNSINTLLIYLQSLRPHQWLKNILVFFPMLASHKLTGSYFLESLFAFISFSLISSSVYIVNDLLDLKADRLHPRKNKRPFASGSIPINNGLILALILFIIGIFTTVLLNKSFLVILLSYFVITSAYSLFLKRKAFIDICALASLYTLRIIGGGAATHIEISFWLLGFSIFIFLSLAAVKRQAEIVDLNERRTSKIIGRNYGVDDLKMVRSIALITGFLSVLVIAAYINSPEVLILYSQPQILWALCCVLFYWLIKMILAANNGKMHDDPLIYAIKDKISQLVFIITIIIILLSVNF